MNVDSAATLRYRVSKHIDTEVALTLQEPPCIGQIEWNILIKSLGSQYASNTPTNTKATITHKRHTKHVNNEYNNSSNIDTEVVFDLQEPPCLGQVECSLCSQYASNTNNKTKHKIYTKQGK